MAKAKRTRAKRAKKKVVRRSMRTNAPKRITRVMSTPIEKAVRDYVALLKDPCNGPLIGPVGATANGYITRFEKTIDINPAQPNWVMKWTPGALSNNGGNIDGLVSYQSATPGGVLGAGYTNDAAPGFAFLGATCQTFRCLAACVQIRYTDSEVNRKGVIGSTICSGARGFATIADAFSVTVDRARIPDQALEVLWQPNDGDEMFSSVQNSAFDVEATARKNGILLAGQGCVTGGVSLRLVAVYQWTPGSNDSMVLPIPKPGTGITMARVIQIAQQAGFLAGHLIKGYATGGLYGVAREVASVIKPSTRLMR